jgi:hypothetical protein
MRAADRKPASQASRPSARSHGVAARVLLAGLAGGALASTLMISGTMTASAAQASATTAASATTVAGTTARIQALLSRPVNGVVNLPAGTFTVRPGLRLSRGEKITGHRTTLRVAAGSGNYAAMLAGATPATDLSGLTIQGVTFDQNGPANPIAAVASLYHGFPRFVVLVSKGTGIRIVSNTFTGADDVNVIATGSATRNVTVNGNVFRAYNAPRHDHSSVYTSGVNTTVSGNQFTGATIYSAAIEVHGDRVTVAGNKIRGYFRGVNVVSSDTTVKGNTVTGAGCPVDLWSTVTPGLRNVVISGNVLNRNLPLWAGVLRHLGLPMPAARSTQPVSIDAASNYQLQGITIRGNK